MLLASATSMLHDDAPALRCYAATLLLRVLIFSACLRAMMPPIRRRYAAEERRILMFLRA